MCVWVLILITPKTKMNSQIEEEQVMPKRGLTVLEADEQGSGGGLTLGLPCLLQPPWRPRTGDLISRMESLFPGNTWRP